MVHQGQGIISRSPGEVTEHAEFRVHRNAPFTVVSEKHLVHKETFRVHSNAPGVAADEKHNVHKESGWLGRPMRLEHPA